MKVSEHFSKDEIKCHCGCGQDFVDPALYDMAEKFRKVVGRAMITHCVNRCPKHNREPGIKGHPKSKHLTGSAMDFHCSGMSVDELHEIAISCHSGSGILSGGLGLYSYGIHIDTGSFRRWQG